MYSVSKLCCKFDKTLPTIKHNIYAIFSSSGLEGECHGPMMQYRVCENPSCPAGVPAFRDWQCQAFSVRSSYQKHVHQWQAVIDDGKYEPCPMFLTSAHTAYSLLVLLLIDKKDMVKTIANKEMPSPRFLASHFYFIDKIWWYFHTLWNLLSYIPVEFVLLGM